MLIGWMEAGRNAALLQGPLEVPRNASGFTRRPELIIEKLKQAIEREALGKSLWNHHRTEPRKQSIWKATLSSFLNTHCEMAGVVVDDRFAMGTGMVSYSSGSLRTSSWIRLTRLRDAYYLKGEAMKTPAQLRQHKLASAFMVGIGFDHDDFGSAAVRRFDASCKQLSDTSLTRLIPVKIDARWSVSRW